MVLFMSGDGTISLDMDSDFACSQINLTTLASGWRANQRGKEGWSTKIRRCFRGRGWRTNFMGKVSAQKLMVHATKEIGLNIFSMARELKNGRIILNTEEISSKDLKKVREF